MKEKLDEFELDQVKKAFQIVDAIVDRHTKSILLQEIWSKFADLLEENGVDI